MIERIQWEFAIQASNETCVQTHTHPVFFVHDPPAPSLLPCQVVPTAVAKADLHVRNPQQREVQLLAIDKCLYGPADQDRCDCALLIHQQLHFIEFKTSETTRLASPGECLRQLAASIVDFYDRGIIQPGDTVFAYASVGLSRQLPQHGAHWRDQKAALQLKIQEGKSRPVRIQYCSESELDIK